MSLPKSPLHDPENYLQNKWLGKIPKYVDGIDFTADPGRTDQSQAKDCDINNIVATYNKTGVMPEGRGAGLFADVSDAPSYQDALQTVLNAENAFMALDAKTRKRFDNDASQMLAFLEDPKNRQEAAALGMLNPEPINPSPAVPASPEAPQRSSNTKAKPESAPKTDEK